MIIFYNKKTGAIIGTVDGRIHDKDADITIRPQGVPKEDIGKEIIKFKSIYGEVEEPEMGLQLVDKEKQTFKQVQIGTKMVKKVVDMIPDVSYKDLISDFEKGKKSIYDYKVKLENGKMIGFEKK